VARLSGLPEIPRRSIFHALNRSPRRGGVRPPGQAYEECRFIVAHLGGGISVGAHCLGRVVDVNNALDGDGPFSPERAGGLPTGGLLGIVASGARSAAELRRRLVGGGGLVAYCGSSSLQEVRAAADRGDKRAALVVEAMAYQIAKEIAMHGATLRGQVDRIVLTGAWPRIAPGRCDHGAGLVPRAGGGDSRGAGDGVPRARGSGCAARGTGTQAVPGRRRGPVMNGRSRSIGFWAPLIARAAQDVAVPMANHEEILGCIGRAIGRLASSSSSATRPRSAGRPPAREPTSRGPDSWPAPARSMPAPRRLAWRVTERPICS